MKITEHAAYQMGATGAEPTECERLLFEAWMRGHCWKVCGEWNGKTYVGANEKGSYVDHSAMLTSQLWAAWRDRAALIAHAAPPADEQPDAMKVLTAALKPFADAFEATGMPQYKGADEEHAGFLDENQITPVRGITMRQFRQAWEVLSGRSALLGKEQA